MTLSSVCRGIGKIKSAKCQWLEARLTLTSTVVSTNADARTGPSESQPDPARELANAVLGRTNKQSNKWTGNHAGKEAKVVNQQAKLAISRKASKRASKHSVAHIFYSTQAGEHEVSLLPCTTLGPAECRLQLAKPVGRKPKALLKRGPASSETGKGKWRPLDGSKQLNASLGSYSDI